MIDEEGGRFYVTGPVTLDNVLALLEDGQRQFRDTGVVVDFSRVSEIDSSAISLMLEWVRRLRVRGIPVSFANLGDSITSLTNLYGVGELIPLEGASSA